MPRQLRTSTPCKSPGMKTAVSVPDDVFEKAEQLARRERRSRSEVYSTALRDVTDAVDRVLADLGVTTDPFVGRAAARILETTEW